jgi:hypothetical protein
MFGEAIRCSFLKAFTPAKPCEMRPTPTPRRNSYMTSQENLTAYQSLGLVLTGIEITQAPVRMFYSSSSNISPTASPRVVPGLPVNQIKRPGN